MPEGDTKARILAAVTSPLGFFTLMLLIVESALGLVLAAAALSDDQKWTVILCMIGIFVLVLLIVAGLAAFAPKNLVFGKEEHAHTAPSALRDQIEDLIHANVKRGCLQHDEATSSDPNK